MSIEEENSQKGVKVGNIGNSPLVAKGQPPIIRN
jgi:hypothetical protein